MVKRLKEKSYLEKYFKIPFIYDFCLEPDWRLSDRVLLENKKKWGNFLVGVLALNQQQLNINNIKSNKNLEIHRPVSYWSK